MKSLIILILLMLPFSICSQELSISDGTINYKSNIIEETYQKEWNELNNSKNFTTTSWIKLDQKYNKMWDKELNSIYQLLLKNISHKQQSLLQMSQRAWLEYYNTLLNFNSNLLLENQYNGSGGKALHYTKLLNEKRKRVYELLEYCHIFDIDYNF